MNTFYYRYNRHILSILLSSIVLSSCADSSTSQPNILAFENSLNAGQWQLLWRGGAGIENWSNPDYIGWDEPLVSACSINQAMPDRVVLTISGNIGDTTTDPQVWADEIDKAITTSTMKYPSLRQIILQTVVGGYHGDICVSDTGEDVRASVNYPVIDQAIDLVVNNHSTNIETIKGISPTVTDCTGFKDSQGHLTLDESNIVGRIIGEYYSINQPGNFICTQVIGFSQTKQWFTGEATF